MSHQINLGNVNGSKAKINGAAVDAITAGTGVTVTKTGNNVVLDVPTVNTKQDKFHGNVNQYVGFDESGKPVAKDLDYTIYGFEIDDNESNPAYKISYFGENKNYRSAKVNRITGEFDYGDWENAFFIRDLKPVMLKYDGTVAYELDKNDYSKKTDGTASDIADDTFAGNVMVGIPTIWIKAENVSATKHRFYISDKRVDPGYHSYTHTDRSGKIKPYTYIAAYNGWVDGSSRLRSISGKNPTRSQTGEVQFNEAAANNVNGDTGWTLGTYASWQMIDLLLLLIGKSTNTQEIFGNGNINGYYNKAAGTDTYGVLPTGTMNDKGLFYGLNHDNLGVKVFGIENWWGNIWKRIAGYFNDNGVYKVKLTQSTSDGSTTIGYNLTAAGYIPITGVIPFQGYIGSMACPSSLGVLVPSSSVSGSGASASSDIGYCDHQWANNSQLDMALLGGFCGYGVRCGAFACYLNDSVAISAWSIGASPHYL